VEYGIGDVRVVNRESSVDFLDPFGSPALVRKPLDKLRRDVRDRIGPTPGRLQAALETPQLALNTLPALQTK
jgi:hypothetical protein